MILQTLVLLLARLNECTACFTPWLLTQPIEQTDWRQALSLVTTYAFVEPVVTLLLQATAVPPWVLALCLGPMNLFAGIFLTIMLHEKSFTEIAVFNKDKPATVADALDPEDGDRRYEARPTQNATTTVLLPPIVSTAILNSSLLLFGQSLDATWIQERSYIINGLGPFAVFINLICRYSDWEIYKRSGRPLTLRQLRSSSVCMPAATCLCVLIGVRICVRRLLGLDPFLAFHRLSPSEADALYPEPV